MNARVAYLTAMVVFFFAKVPDITERTVGVVNVYRWYKEDKKCKDEDLHDLVRKKVNEY